MTDPDQKEYQSSIAEFYDWIPAYAKRTDLAFYINYAKSTHGKTLELGCGTGRILIPTAVAGCEIFGLELSKYMLAKCQEKLKKQPVQVQKRVQLMQGDMISFKINETFKLITIPFHTFQHLISVEDQISCLLCIKHHLSKEGKLLFDLFQVNPQKIHDPAFTEETEDTPEMILPDGRKFRRCNRVVSFHKVEQYNDVELIHYITYPNGKIERLVQPFPFRYFYKYEVEHLLARCGFKVTALFGDFHGSPLAENSPEMIFVCEKDEN
jgi:SAM-dependent methyltransferase